jgi:hypothetical protein
MRAILASLYVLLILTCGCRLAVAQTLPRLEDLSDARQCEATLSLPASVPVRSLNSLDPNQFKPDSTSNLSACFGVYYARHDILETCTRYAVDFNRPCVAPVQILTILSSPLSLRCGSLTKSRFSCSSSMAHR